MTRLPLLESEVQATVLVTARMFGWRVAHFRPAEHRGKWMTPVAADGAGWPDLVLVRRDRVIFRELKVGNNRLSAEQAVWLEALQAAGCDVGVWRVKVERDLDEILEQLR